MGSKYQTSRDYQEPVLRWLTTYCRNRSVLLAVGSVGALLVSIPVLIVTWWGTWVFLFFFGFVAMKLQTLSIVTWVIMGLLFIAYLTTNRQYLETLKFDEDGTHLTATRFAMSVAGYSSLSLFITSHNNARSNIKMISQLLLCGPALVGLAVRLAKASYVVSRLNLTEVSHALTIMLDLKRRVAIDVLSKKTNCISPPNLMRELLLIDGVVFLSSDEPALTMTDSLRDTLESEIAKHAKAD